MDREQIDYKSLLDQLDRIERYSMLAAKDMLTLDDVSVLTGLSKIHLYRLTCKKEIPHYKPNGKIVFFDRKEINEWMRQNKQV